MYIDLEQFMLFLLITLRMTGMFVTNPIFGRRNIPPVLGIGISLMIGAMLYSSMTFAPLPELNLLSFIFMALMEFSVGFAAGIVMQLFLAILIIGGEVIDMQLGLGMAKIFDPGTNASVSLTANMLNALFILVFFVTNNHLTLIYMTAQTFNIIPVGTVGISPAALYYLPNLFSSIMIFAIKLCIPLIVIEVIVTMVVGIIMRIIPQINIFVLSIQFKLIVGIFALFILVGPFMAYFENLLIICFERVQEVWLYFVV